MASLYTNIYNTLIRRNSVFLTTIFVGAFSFQLAFQSASDKIWDSINAGRQWKDVKHRYMTMGGDEEE